MLPAIKSCPFCGWNSSQVAETTTKPTGRDEAVPAFYVTCAKCDARGPTIAQEVLHVVSEIDARTGAISRWNGVRR